MGLLQKLKSALGLDGSESSGRRSSGDVDVTVEREPSTESEDAVKGTETATTADSAADTGTGTETESETGTETKSETETETDADSSADSESDAAEESEDAAEEDVDADLIEDEIPEGTEEESEAAAADATVPEAEPDDGSSLPVTEIKGIGPAYAERLSGLDIESVGDLAAADAADIAAETDLSESRVAGWIERAQDY
ncbi:helix-hairpin-helix domain-containing protein [Haloarcula marina]|uniref:helix-hairpin-helix domain-containing protein n=1 Tax=Haloarcula marina TaxID=2961574 RepID=UPI0020B74634|nr:helix-hairpin-helix domain-containing protein [Halomicroarcula marina]